MTSALLLPKALEQEEFKVRHVLFLISATSAPMLWNALEQVENKVPVCILRCVTSALL